MVTKTEKYELNDIKIEKIMQLDKNKLYLFQFAGMTCEDLAYTREKLIEEGFREDCIFINCDDLNVYEVV